MSMTRLPASGMFVGRFGVGRARNLRPVAI